MTSAGTSISFRLKCPGALDPIAGDPQGQRLGRIQLMIPMISGLQELLDARRILREADGGPRPRRAHDDHTLRTGIMIEVPSAVAMAEILASMWTSSASAPMT